MMENAEYGSRRYRIRLHAIRINVPSVAVKSNSVMSM
jgi:hypothetical protein